MEIEKLLRTEAGGLTCPTAPPSPPSTPLAPNKQLAPVQARAWRWAIALVALCALLTTSGLLLRRAYRLSAFSGEATESPPPAQSMPKPPLSNASFSMMGEGSCPAEWTPLRVHADGPARCFRVLQTFRSHYECTTTLCSAVDRNGTRLDGTLAMPASAEEQRLLQAKLFAGKDAWIGLYLSRPDRAGWHWVDGGPLDEPLAARAADGHINRFGSEECAYVSGRTGEWDDFDCFAAHFRCLCELGSAASGAYLADMADRMDELDREAFRYRVWLALVVGAFLSYPLLANRHSSSHRGLQHLHKAPQEGTRRSLQRDLMFSVGVLLFLGAFAPYMLQEMGLWRAFRLGSWTSYFPLGPLVVIAMVSIPPHSRHQCSIGFILASMFALIAVFLLKEVQLVEWFYTACLWLGMALVLLYASCSLFLQVYACTQRGSPMREMCDSTFFYGRVVAFASGMMVLLLFVCPAALSDPLYLEHPFAPGVIATSVSWMAAGLLFSRENLMKLLGIHFDFDDSDEGVEGSTSSAPEKTAI